jgi:hypothetical protein
VSETSRTKPILRTRSKAFALLVFISALAIAAHLFQPTNWPSLGIDILHSLHGPGFAVLALLILWYLQHQCRSVINYVLAAAIAMGIGLVSEIAQIPGARDAQVIDLVVDGLGIFGVIGVSASLDKNVRQMTPTWARLMLPSAAGVALAVTCVPTLWLGHALIQQKNAFPTLLTFESRWETAAFGQTPGHRPTRVAAPADWPGDGSIVARAVEDGRWGIYLSLYPLPDWRGYERLKFLVASVDNELDLDMCIRDKYVSKGPPRNQYCKSMQIGPEPREFSIPFSEILSGSQSGSFDFSRVDAVVFSAAKPGTKSEILIDDIRLEP